MTETYGPASSGAGDNFTDGAWQAFFSAMFSDGIIPGVLNGLAVTPGTGMQVLVDTGQAIVHGLWYQNDASKALSLATADPSNARYDAIVLHADLVAKTIALQVITGTPGASPSEPGITQSSSEWEVRIARVFVPAGTTSITSGNIGAPGTGPNWATPNLHYGQKIAQALEFFYALLSNNTYMTALHVYPGGSSAAAKVYPLDHGASAAALAGAEWHLEGMHNGSLVDMISAVSGAGGGRAAINFNNMKIILGTGNQTGVAHGLGVQPDIILINPINTSPVSWSVFNIGATTFDVHVSITDSPWVALAIKLG